MWYIHPCRFFPMDKIMALDLVLDIGNSLIKGGIFEGKTLLNFFAIPATLASTEDLARHIRGKGITNVLISSVNSKVEEPIIHALELQQIQPILLDHTKLKLILDVDEPQQLGHDRIANCYGALAQFPTNDCIVIDIGTAITADLVTKEGHYLGGMIYPGATLCAKALADHTDKLPLVSIKKPESPLAKTTETHLQGGIYYGQLGAIERLIAELKNTAYSPISVKVIATGGATRIDDTKADSENAEFVDELAELVDFINPHLTLIGMHEILNELNLK